MNKKLILETLENSRWRTNSLNVWNYSINLPLKNNRHESESDKTTQTHIHTHNKFFFKNLSFNTYSSFILKFLMKHNLSLDRLFIYFQTNWSIIEYYGRNNTVYFNSVNLKKKVVHCQKVDVHCTADLNCSVYSAYWIRVVLIVLFYTSCSNNTAMLSIAIKTHRIYF